MTKILACLPHYFDKSRKEHSVLGSSQDDPKDRAKTIDYCVKQLQSMLCRDRYLMGTLSSEPGSIVNAYIQPQNSDMTGDVVICTSGSNHLLEMCEVKGYTQRRSVNPDPRLLSYECRKVFIDHINEYDLFFYTEDDITPLDAEFFKKAKRFYELFGENKIVLPHRFELFGFIAAKVYLEHPTPPRYRFAPEFVEEKRLYMSSFDGDVEFEWTTNQAAGCYIVTKKQLKKWSEMPYFWEPSPIVDMMIIEQGQVPMLGRFPIYKTALPRLEFFEVHHIPNRACHAKTPSSKIAEHYRSSRKSIA